MIFYEKETAIGLACASLPALVSLYYFFIKGDRKLGIGFLLLSALLVRLLIISLDPFIHEWDERFHGLVAKNMMTHPFRPTLIDHPVLPYDVTDWSTNHVWVHKQPVFLWQMALSMKLFGVNTFAMRLPSALLGVFMVFMIYDLGRKWMKSEYVGYAGAFLSTFSYYTLELTSGWRSLEHNDLVFTVYVTASCWAFVNYLQDEKKLKWVALVGLFAGLAILNKWLVGLLIFGGWGLYLLLSLPKISFQRAAHLFVAILMACIIFIPWQVYIQNAFPLEAAASYGSNKSHMQSDLGHPGTHLYHIQFLSTAYHRILLVFLVIGMLAVFYKNQIDRKLTISFLAMIIVLFAFFSFLVPTKMPAFVFPVSGLLFSFMAYGLFAISNWISKRWSLAEVAHKELLMVLILLAGFFSLKPKSISDDRSNQNTYRNGKLHNMSIFKKLDSKVLEDRIFFNCKSFENIELMFYRDAAAYHWYPPPGTVDSLQSLGYKLAAFEFPAQHLPDHILKDPEIIIMEADFK